MPEEGHVALHAGVAVNGVALRAVTEGAVGLNPTPVRVEEALVTVMFIVLYADVEPVCTKTWRVPVVTLVPAV
jgi:hypothetical protein